MAQMIKLRKQPGPRDERYDLFSNLLGDSPDGEPRLVDSELIGTTFPLSKRSTAHTMLGNIFIFLLAGHEVKHLFGLDSCRYSSLNRLQTTAHALTFSFALLALYPEKQEKLFQHIQETVSSLGHAPVRPCCVLRLSVC